MELPYMEDVRNYEFAPVHNEKVKPSDEQLGAVDDLIESMMLATPDNKTEDALQTETVLNPGYQYLYACLSHRATRPGQVLPDLPAHVRRLMAPPEEVTGEGTSDALRRIGTEFTLEEVRKRKRGEEEEGKGEPEKNGGEPEKKRRSSGAGDAAGPSQTVTEVGAANPVQDFEQLLRNGEALIPGETFNLDYLLLRSRYVNLKFQWRNNWSKSSRT